MGKTSTLFLQFGGEELKPKKVKPKSPRHKADQFSLFDPLDQPAGEVVFFERGNRVPNLFPTNTNVPYRLAVIGEAPGEDEERTGIPFVGQSGRMLDQILSKLGVLRTTCFIGNVCQFRPPKNDIKFFTDTNASELREGVDQLRKDLAKYKPNLCLLLGKTALYIAKGTYKIGDWRGSLFMSDRLIDPGTEFTPPEVKCLASYHPAYCLRQYEWLPVLTFDIRKAIEEAKTSELVLPQRDLLIHLSHAELINELDHILEHKVKISPDIEGGVHSMSCCSLATSKSKSILIPFAKMDGGNFWPTLEEELEIWRRFNSIMSSRDIVKIFQNGLYDRFVLQYGYQCLVRNAKEDIMLKFWEMWCELEKNLGFQNSILTKEPFYKFERKTDDQDTFFRYCCKDSSTTFEIDERVTRMLDAGQVKHYQQNMVILHALLYMELKGIRYNQALADTRLIEMKDHVYGFQEELDGMARQMNVIEGINFEKPRDEIINQVQLICCYKRDGVTPKKKYLENGYDDVLDMLRTADLPLSVEQRGAVSVLTETTMNTKSKFFKDFLYVSCGLPTQYKKDPKTKEMRPTTNYEALLKLSKSYQHPVLKCALELSRLRTRAQMLAIKSIHGRMHCSYNLVGSETGRVSCSKSVIPIGDKKVGANIQTTPDDWDLEDEEHPLSQGMRDLFLADEGCYLGKLDLKGADGWTIGAYLAMLGDPTMLDDLKFGLKPAQIVAYILMFGASAVSGKTRQELKELVKVVTKEAWQYFVSKQGTWGTCYTMGPRKLGERVFIESEGKVNMGEKEAREFQACISVRYRIDILHKYFTRQIEAHPYPFKLVAPNGFVRKFYGRKSEVLGEVLAHMPQVITTHATNMAAYRLWTDPENRIRLSSSACKLRVAPVHQMHDELVLQWRIKDTLFALGKIKEWFNNPIIIANQKLVIPFDGSYGTNWSMDEHAKVGSIN